MQLTRFDRWLREAFVYQTQIYTLRAVESLPSGIKAVKIPDVPGKRYKFLYIANKSKAADSFILRLKEAGQMYTTQVVDRNCWYVPFIAPKSKSVTWWVISMLVTLFALGMGLVFATRLASDPEFRANFSDALNFFRG